MDVNFARRIRVIIGFATIAFQCSSVAMADTYTTSGSNILDNGTAWCGSGVNDFDQFGLTNNTGYHIKIVREPIDDFSQAPMAASTSIQFNGSTLHSLQDIVNNNRAEGEITILCPFGWNTSVTQIDSLTPSAQSFWSAYKTQLAAMATQFKGQSDVWIDLWNEPYSSSGIDSTWSSDMTAMYNAVRNTGNTSIILVPCENYSQVSSVYSNSTGKAFLSGKTNIITDIHAYGDWTEYEYYPSVPSTVVNQTTVANDIAAIEAAGWPVLFGECGTDAQDDASGNWAYRTPTNTDYYDVQPFLTTTEGLHVPVVGWAWNSSDSGVLISNGSPTYWGNVFLPNIPKDYSSAGPIGHKIALYSPASGYYASVNLNGSDTYTAGFATSIGSWETVEVYNGGNGYMGLYSPASGYYVSVNDGWEDNLQAAWATTIGTTEEYRWSPQSNGDIALEAPNGWYVSTDLSNNDWLTTSLADGYVSSWEQFTWTDLGPY